MIRALAHYLILPILLIGLAGCLPDIGSSANVEYEVIEIGPGGDSIGHAHFSLNERPTALNESEQVVGMYAPDNLESGQFRGFYWSEDDGFHTIEPFSVTDEEEDSLAWDIDATGAVYGFAENAGNDGKDEALKWTLEGGLERLRPSSDGSLSKVLGVNDNQDLAGTCAPPVSTADICVRLDGTWHMIEALGNSGATAYAINNEGVVAATTSVSIDGTRYNRPAMWDSDEGLRDIGSLAGEPTAEGGVNDINNHSQIVGYTDSPDTPRSTGFLWDDGDMIEMGHLDGDSGQAFAINDDGYAAGQIHIVNKNHGILWTPDNKAIDLNERIDRGSGWHLTAIFDINNAGAMVGVAERDGEDYSVLLRPIDDE